MIEKHSKKKEETVCLLCIHNGEMNEKGKEKEQH
jgi:hypothetical protein